MAKKLVPAKSKRYIMQPNVITLTKFFGCDLMMQKIITTLSLAFQDSVSLNIERRQTEQLSMFDQNNNLVYIRIPYATIIKEPSNYGEVRKALKKLAMIPVEIPYRNTTTGENRIRLTGLLRADIPAKPNYDKVIVIEMEKMVVERFIEMDLDENGPIKFTKFLYDVTQNATSKHTAPIYKLLASWRTRGVYRVRWDELKEILCIPSKSYLEYGDFKKRVLKPVQEDLLGRADLWFDCDKDDFKEVKNSEIWLNFILITPAISEHQFKQKEHLKNTLYDYGFSELEMNEIGMVINNTNISIETIWYQIGKINEAILANNKDCSKERIVNQSAYMLKSLINYFKI